MNTSRPVKEYLHIPDQNGDRKLSEGFKATDKQKLVFDAFVQYNITFNKDQRLDALVLVPKRLVVEADVECPIHVRFHGGGFYTGATTFEPWFAYHVRELALMNNAITILPSYRKMPEVHGKELFDDVDSFWQWYLSPQGRKELEEKTKVRFHNYEKPLVSGESAGGHLAVYSWWTQKKLKIAGIYLQYPMLRAYTRGLQDLGSGGQGQIYRGVSIPEGEIQQVARANFGFLVKEKGQIEPRVNSDPPLGMDMAFISSTSRVELDFDGKMVKWSFWKYWFQQPDIFDRLEAVLGPKTKQNIQGHTPFGTSGKVIFRNDKGEVEQEAAKEWPDYYCKAPDPDGPNYCPPFFISQGGEDKNCPDTDATEFKNLLGELYPKAKNDIELIIRPGQPHAWDYKVDMNSQDDKWLLDGLMRVTKSWSTGQPKVVEQTAFDTADDVVER